MFRRPCRYPALRLAEDGGSLSKQATQFQSPLDICPRATKRPGGTVRVEGPSGIGPEGFQASRQICRGGRNKRGTRARAGGTGNPVNRLRCASEAQMEERMKRMKFLFGQRRMQVLLTLAVLLLAASVVIGSGANFTSTSANAGNVFTAGNLSHLNSNDGTYILRAYTSDA